ncbi:hypothetical protein QYE76_034588 [Lolium multiflorum]|uniref:Fanconi Anaemia group E protein C-terminal domain-containing protein n=1 Tax=Lolium multiflorum TaxID=4521 RepID=A0AAD8QYY1_LOLMU|nr:hypothetical protein QYE76_034588 [Lolium multiflorum]
MEPWLPLLRHLLASPAPNAAAFSSSSNNCSSSAPPAAGLLRILLSPVPTLPASEPTTVLFQTLPPLLQSQALSFLSSSAPLLDPIQVRSLASRVLSAPPGRYHFWVRQGARHLLDGLPDKDAPGVPWEFIQEFHEPPPWLKEEAARARPVLPWLPLDCRNMMPSRVRTVADGLDGVRLESLDLEQDEFPAMQEVGCPPAPPLGDSVVRRAQALQKEIELADSVLDAQQVAKDLHDLCLESGNAEAVLSLVQPWEADDDTVRVLLSHLVLEEDGMRGKGPALVLCSLVLPKLLGLQRAASSGLVSAALDVCKRHPAAALEAVLFPLVLRKEGLNVPQCDVLTRIVKDCMHPLHVTAFCHRLLSGEEEERRPVCMPQHRENIGADLVWTESLFVLFNGILNQDIRLTPSTIEKLVSIIDRMAMKLRKSLKFGNFFLCFVSKCWQECKIHRLLLERAAETTDTFLTKAILAKLRPTS